MWSCIKTREQLTQLVVRIFSVSCNINHQNIKNKANNELIIGLSKWSGSSSTCNWFKCFIIWYVRFPGQIKGLNYSAGISTENPFWFMTWLNVSLGNGPSDGLQSFFFFPLLIWLKSAINTLIKQFKDGTGIMVSRLKCAQGNILNHSYKLLIQ